MEQQAPSACVEEHPCPCCERVFPTAERLAVHVKVHRGGPKRPLKCEQCCRTFPRIDKLRAHQLVHRVGKPHKCEICDKAFTHKQTLVEHLLRHTGVRHHECDLCPKSFYFRFDLESHRRRHTGERPYKCSICQRHFVGRADLLRHERSHSGDRPYRCTVCKRGFGRNSILERHMMCHTGERPYKCHLCPNTFTRLYLLQEHCKNHPQPQRNLGGLVQRRKTKKRSGQCRTANAAATASTSAIPGVSPSSASPLSAQEPVAGRILTVPEEKLKLESTQGPAAILMLMEQPKKTPSPHQCALSSKVKPALKAKTKKGKEKSILKPGRTLSGGGTTLNAKLSNPPGPSFTSSEDQNSDLLGRAPGKKQKSALHNVISLKISKNRQKKQPQLISVAAGIASDVVDNETPNSPSFPAAPLLDTPTVKQASRAKDLDHPDRISASPLSPETHYTQLSAKAQPLHNTVGTFKILQAGSCPSDLGQIMSGPAVPSVEDSCLFLSNPLWEQPPQHVPEALSSTLHYLDLPYNHEAFKAEPEAVLGLSCPLWESQNLQETNDELSTELKEDLVLMHSLSSCPVVPEGMQRQSRLLSATLDFVSAWSKGFIQPKDGSS